MCYHPLDIKIHGQKCYQQRHPLTNGPLIYFAYLAGPYLPKPISDHILENLVQTMFVAANIEPHERNITGTSLRVLSFQVQVRTQILLHLIL